MNTKILLGGIVGGVTFFLLGWLIYGIILTDFMTTNMNQCMATPMDQMNLPLIFVSNLCWGLVMALIYNWSNTTNVMDGAKMAAVIGVLVGLATDLMFHSMSTMFSSFTAILVDVAALTVMLAVGGAAITWVMNRGKAA